MRIPIREIGEAIRGIIWSECSSSLGLKSAQFTLFEPADLSEDFVNYFPSVLILEPTWETSRPPGRSQMGWPLQTGTIGFLVVFARTFAQSDTSPAWTSALLQECETIENAITKTVNGQFFPGQTLPSDTTIPRVWINRVGMLGQPDSEQQSVRLAEAQIYVSVDVEIEMD